MHVPQTEVLLRFDGVELARVILPPGEYVIGRSPEAAIYAETPLLSRRHARLTIGRDHIGLEDLGSSNGTFVDDQQIAGSARVSPGQAVRLGDVQLVIEFAPAPPRGVPEELLAARPYAVGDQIARGGMGAILTAQQKALERPVAMKVMLDDADPDAVRRFVDEAKVTGQLTHPNIVPIHELGVDERGQVFYTMKMVRGITLKKVIELLGEGVEGTKKKYPLPTLLTVFQKACDAVAFAHAHGVIHRDLKPENIMLGDYGEVLVMDWGLAKRIKDEGRRVRAGLAVKDEEVSGSAEGPTSSSLTLAGTIMGTPAYMAPEQARGEIEALDARSDIYALGAILFELLHLRPAVTGRSAMEIVDKVGRGEIAAPDADSVPDSLAAVVRKAMALAPSARYAAVEELQRDLTAYQSGFATAAEKAGLGRHLLLAVKRHKAVAASIAAALAILAVVVAGFTIKVVAERDRAERALADLQKTAPTLIAEGRKLIDAQQFDGALGKINFAAEIEPRNAGYRLLRAQLLQAMLRLEEAAAEFRHVLALNPEPGAKESALANLALCEKLRREYPSTAAFDRAAYQHLYELMEKESRSTQAVPIAIKLGLAKDASQALLKARLVEWRKIPGWKKTSENERVRWNPDGTLSLRFESTLLDDLSSLQGLPLSLLWIHETKVTDLEPLRGMRLRDFRTIDLPKPIDLSPLQGMPLEYLQCETAVVDLRPLAGMSLKRLRLADWKVRDASVFRGMPLQEIFFAGSLLTHLNDFANAPAKVLQAPSSWELTDISVVRTMPGLKDVDFSDCTKLRDLTPLLDCPALEGVRVPRDCEEIAVLRQHPRIKGLSYALGQGKPAPEFWAEFDKMWSARHNETVAREKMRAAFVSAGQPPLEDKAIARLADGTFRLNLSPMRKKLTALPDLRGLPVSAFDMTDAPIPTFAPLVGVPVRELIFYGAPAIDLAPLRECSQLEHLHLTSNPALRDLSALKGMKLRRLLVYATGVADLSPLAGMPLNRLVCDKTKVTDLTPLQTCVELTVLQVEDNPALRDLSPLTALKLQTLSVSGTGVVDLAPLAGMPLRELRLGRTKITDLRPLLQCRELESLILPANATGIGELRALPKLTRISTRWDAGLETPAQSASEFWAEYDAQQKATAK